MIEVTQEQLDKNGITNYPSTPCDLNVGDIVTYKNDYGVSFKNKKIIGFSNDPVLIRIDRFIHLESDTWWFPVKREELTKERNE